MPFQSNYLISNEEQRMCKEFENVGADFQNKVKRGQLPLDFNSTYLNSEKMGLHCTFIPLLTHPLRSHSETRRTTGGW